MKVDRSHVFLEKEPQQEPRRLPGFRIGSVSMETVTSDWSEELDALITNRK